MLIPEYMITGNTMITNKIRAVSYYSIKTLPEVITALDVTLLDASKALLVVSYLQQYIPTVATGCRYYLDFAIIQV